MSIWLNYYYISNKQRDFWRNGNIPCHVMKEILLLLASAGFKSIILDRVQLVQIVWGRDKVHCFDLDKVSRYEKVQPSLCGSPQIHALAIWPSFLPFRNTVSFWLSRKCYALPIIITLILHILRPLLWVGNKHYMAGKTMIEHLLSNLKEKKLWRKVLSF